MLERFHKQESSSKVERTEEKEINPNEFTPKELAMIQRVLAEAPQVLGKAEDVPIVNVDPNRHPVMEGEALQNFFNSAKDPKDPVWDLDADDVESGLDKAA